MLFLASFGHSPVTQNVKKKCVFRLLILDPVRPPEPRPKGGPQRVNLGGKGVADRPPNGNEWPNIPSELTNRLLVCCDGGFAAPGEGTPGPGMSPNGFSFFAASAAGVSLSVVYGLQDRGWGCGTCSDCVGGGMFLNNLVPEASLLKLRQVQVAQH